MAEYIIHCSDAPNGRKDTAADVHRWHKERGWDGIGYHYFITVDGHIECGRPEYWVGAHCRGHNEKIGVCLAGKDKFTDCQQQALKLLINHNATSVRGHYQYDKGKTCPNFDVEHWFYNGGDWPLLEK